jgi:branched-subunit amino acid aminotransferase/4-amino-4-deoxychorismate lyase
VLGSDEVFLVNSLAGVWPVRDLDGELRMPGEMTRAVQGWLEQDDDA